jgi:hypothetical protein
VDDTDRVDDIGAPESKRWLEFEPFVMEILKRTPGITVSHTDDMSGLSVTQLDQGCNVTADRNGRALLVEIRSQTPQTKSRLRGTVAQIRDAADRYKAAHPGAVPELLAAFPGVLSGLKLDLFRSEAVEVWDGRYLQRQARQLGMSVPDFVAALEGEERPEDREPADELHRRLGRIKPGREDATRYESFCEETLKVLFCPPLNPPIPQSEDYSRANRRDLILPNYSTRGFWHFMRNTYHADYIVAEAKNLSYAVGKTEVLQLANYLSRHGVGLVGPPHDALWIQHLRGVDQP